MNKIYNKALIVVFVISALALSSCSKNLPLNITQNQIEENISSGDWQITKFIDSDQDETSDFTAYSFTFSGNGDLSAVSSNNSYTGTWSISDSNSNDDSSNDLHFNIYFNLSNDFESLNDDWDIISQTDNKIELIDVSGGNGGTDYLTFDKK